VKTGYIIGVILALAGALFFAIIEAFIIPGFGLMGVLSFILFAIAVYIAYSQLGNIWAGLTLILGIVLFFLIMKIFSKSKVWRETRLDRKLRSSEGYRVEDEKLKNYLNKKGKALSNLHPVGIVEIDGERIDAQSEAGLFIPVNSNIEVIEIEGTKLIVKEIK
jgi:membrane-bound serine protease (ClpP class)